MEPTPQFSRRDAFKWLAVASAAGSACASFAAKKTGNSLVERNDAAVRDILVQQIIDPANAGRGCVPDHYGFHTAQSAAGIIETLATALVHPKSAFHGDADVYARIALATGFLERAQTKDGNVELLVTNFNSPPDTGFVTHLVATAAALGQRYGREDLMQLLRPFLERGAAAMVVGGIHTPNHRWVVSAALAQVHALFPDPRYVTRIDEWLAEGIDIDGDGQFTERSTLTYDPITDRALVVIADKLQRPELFEPVRRNLRSLALLLHQDGEVVTEISRRQDQFTRGDVRGYWFPATWLARRDRDATFAALAHAAVEGARLATLLEYPELAEPLVDSAPLPDDFAQVMPALQVVRIRRQALSATVLLQGSSRLLTLRHGGAVLEGVRMASAFFGKGQFVPDKSEVKDGVYRLQQALEGPYYQPLGEKVAAADWYEVRGRRRQTQVCKLEQTAEIREVKNGIEVRLRAHGTDGVPVAVEFSFRDGGQLAGCEPLAELPGCFLLRDGSGEYRSGGHAIRFGAGAAPHGYTQVRGAEPKLPGQSVYVTGFTPFDRTFTFECT